jgi:hypothetical protein
MEGAAADAALLLELPPDLPRINAAPFPLLAAAAVAAPPRSPAAPVPCGIDDDFSKLIVLQDLPSRSVCVVVAVGVVAVGDPFKIAPAAAINPDEEAEIVTVASVPLGFGVTASDLIFCCLCSCSCFCRAANAAFCCSNFCCDAASAALC